jgi:L-arabinokinase
LTSIAYYISGHGFGHAVRSLQVIHSLKERCAELKIHIRSPAPKWLLDHFPFPVSYERRTIDVGIVQPDSLEMDIEETLRACQELHRRIPGIIEEELAFMQREKILLVIGDVPPLCFEIATRASLPSVAIANFTWDWIYRAYLPEFPSFEPLIEEMEGSYRQASLCLSLPLSCDLNVFPRRVPIPLIARISAMNKQQARERFGLPVTAKVILASFGGCGLERLPWEAIKRHGDFFFVTTGALPKREKNFVVLPDALPNYEDLFRAADVVVSKPGYGVVADVIAHRVPLLYTSRGPFPEYPFLVQALNEWATSDFIPQEELLAGNLGPYLDRLLAKEQNWPTVPLNGAQVASEKILDLLK